MATLKKEEGKNFPTDIYIFGKGFFTDGELPIKENIQKAIDLAKNITEGTVGTAQKAFSIMDFISEYWKLLSIGAVALIVLLKD